MPVAPARRAVVRASASSFAAPRNRVRRALAEPGPGDHRHRQRCREGRKERVESLDPGVAASAALFGVAVGLAQGCRRCRGTSPDRRLTPVGLPQLLRGWAATRIMAVMGQPPASSSPAGLPRGLRPMLATAGVPPAGPGRRPGRAGRSFRRRRHRVDTGRRSIPAGSARWPIILRSVGWILDRTRRDRRHEAGRVYLESGRAGVHRPHHSPVVSRRCVVRGRSGRGRHEGPVCHVCPVERVLRRRADARGWQPGAPQPPHLPRWRRSLLRGDHGLGDQAGAGDEE